MSIGKRIKEERMRLDLNQTDFAEIAGITKKTQVELEKDTSNPKSSYLIAIQNKGVDLPYVLSGVRSKKNTPSKDVDYNNLHEPFAHPEVEEPSTFYGAPKDSPKIDASKPWTKEDDETLAGAAQRMARVREAWNNAKKSAGYNPPIQIEKTLHLMLMRGDISEEGAIYLLTIMKEVFEK